MTVSDDWRAGLKAGVRDGRCRSLRDVQQHLAHEYERYTPVTGNKQAAGSDACARERRAIEHVMSYVNQQIALWERGKDKGT